MKDKPYLQAGIWENDFHITVPCLTNRFIDFTLFDRVSICVKHTIHQIAKLSIALLWLLGNFRLFRKVNRIRLTIPSPIAGIAPYRPCRYPLRMSAFFRGANSSREYKSVTPFLLSFSTKQIWSLRKRLRLSKLTSWVVTINCAPFVFLFPVTEYT